MMGLVTHAIAINLFRSLVCQPKLQALPTSRELMMGRYFLRTFLDTRQSWNYIYRELEFTLCIN